MSYPIQISLPGIDVPIEKDFRQALRFALAGAQTTRYHTMPVLIQETVGHHSHGVAVLATLLYPDASRDLLVAALYHDLAEHVTGDMPAPVKRELGLRKALAEYEDQLCQDAGLVTPKLSPEDERRLKFCDSAHGGLYCMQEINRGNRKMKTIKDKFVSYLHEITNGDRVESQLIYYISEGIE